jgi:hypothetical protein
MRAEEKMMGEIKQLLQDVPVPPSNSYDGLGTTAPSEVLELDEDGWEIEKDSEGREIDPVQNEQELVDAYQEEGSDTIDIPEPEETELYESDESDNDEDERIAVMTGVPDSSIRSFSWDTKDGSYAASVFYNGRSPRAVTLQDLTGEGEYILVPMRILEELFGFIQATRHTHY